MDLPKSMAPTAKKARFFFKGFPEDLRFKSHSVPESMERAKGTLYETWFKALQLSSFYQESCESHLFRSDKAKECFELFGDLRNLTFEEWWLKRGFGIFSEKRPFNKIAVDNQEDEFGINVPILSIEIPLNVSPRTLRNQFDNLLEQYHPHYKDFDRWKASTAPARLQAKKFTSASLDLCLLVLEKFQEKEKQGQVLLYEIGEDLRLNPRLNVVKSDRLAEIAEKHIKMASTVSEYLEKAKNLVAHATEGCFPLTDNHPWIERKTRSSRKI